ncbi:hypothetical protein P154DRAFT_35103 [Amniculicola lignicola CBS 123094]|uniref:Uncharacterized protein n=1 Tax=Amniculicola lignicola CBS 123094 TaxID=1392246 RepID=A0A6A5WWT7_9PLEO|nr:hypothetical protein P154DRAFT_35103 [Amniculicola lignicola CBS 123094]
MAARNVLHADADPGRGGTGVDDLTTPYDDDGKSFDPSCGLSAKRCRCAAALHRLLSVLDRYSKSLPTNVRDRLTENERWRAPTGTWSANRSNTGPTAGVGVGGVTALRCETNTTVGVARPLGYSKRYCTAARARDWRKLMGAIGPELRQRTTQTECCITIWRQHRARGNECGLVMCEQPQSMAARRICFQSGEVNGVQGCSKGLRRQPRTQWPVWWSIAGQQQ